METKGKKERERPKHLAREGRKWEKKVFAVCATRIHMANTLAGKMQAGGKGKSQKSNNAVN
jgi:hypothetical protein